MARARVHRRADDRSRARRGDPTRRVAGRSAGGAVRHPPGTGRPRRRGCVDPTRAGRQPPARTLRRATHARVVPIRSPERRVARLLGSSHPAGRGARDRPRRHAQPLGDVDPSPRARARPRPRPRRGSGARGRARRRSPARTSDRRANRRRRLAASGVRPGRAGDRSRRRRGHVAVPDRGGCLRGSGAGAPCRSLRHRRHQRRERRRSGCAAAGRGAGVGVGVGNCAADRRASIRRCTSRRRHASCSTPARR